MGLENGPDRDVPVQAQIDQVLAAKKWLNENPATWRDSKDTRKGEVGAGQIATFLGKKTWSERTVSRLLQLATLPGEVKEKIKNPQEINQKGGKKKGLGVMAAT